MAFPKSVTQEAMASAPPMGGESARDVLKEALTRAADGEPVESLLGEYDTKLAEAYESDEDTGEEDPFADLMGDDEEV
jgi:hypothetical protein